MIFPADVKVDADQNVWMISDRMPNFLLDSLDYTDINFRIFTQRLDDLVADTVCDPRVPVHQSVHNRFGPSTLVVTPVAHNHYTPLAKTTSYVNHASVYPVHQQIYPVSYHHEQSHFNNEWNGHHLGNALHQQTSFDRKFGQKREYHHYW